MTIEVVVPTELDDAQREAVEALAAAFTDDPRAELFDEAARTEGAPMADTRALYVISVAAELAGVHPQTLRIYERKGLLARRARAAGSRRYSDHDIAAAAPHPGAHQRGHLARRRAADPGARGRSSQRGPRRVAPGSRRVSTRCSSEMEERVAAAHQQYRREIVPLRTAAVVLGREHATK